MTTALTKLDVAHRQLAVAIRLFFDDQDPVSVYTLAANAWEIVDKLCRIRDVDSLSEQTRGNLSNGQSLRRDLINQPYRNFSNTRTKTLKERSRDFPMKRMITY